MTPATLPTTDLEQTAVVLARYDNAVASGPLPVCLSDFFPGVAVCFHGLFREDGLALGGHV